MTTLRFNPPPEWPIPPGWEPPAGWGPDPLWPPAPLGWRFWPDTDSAAHAQSSPPGRGRKAEPHITAHAVDHDNSMDPSPSGGVDSHPPETPTDVPTRRRRLSRRSLVIGAVAVAVVAAGTAFVLLRTEQSIGVSIAVPHSVQGLALDPTSQTLYVVSYKENSVSMVDLSTRTVTATVAVGERPQNAAVDPTSQRVYVANTGSSSVSVIDGISQQVTATVPVTGASGVAVDPTTHQVYVTGNDVLSVLDGETYAVLATIPVGHFPGSVAVDPDTHRVYVGYGQGSVRGTEISEQRVTVVDGLEHVVVEDIPVTGCSCFGLEVDPRTHDVFDALYDRSKVAVLDGTNNANVEYIDVVGNSGSVAIDPGNQTAYIAHISNKGSAARSGDSFGHAA